MSKDPKDHRQQQSQHRGEPQAGKSDPESESDTTKLGDAIKEFHDSLEAEVEQLTKDYSAMLKRHEEGEAKLRERHQSEREEAEAVLADREHELNKTKHVMAVERTIEEEVDEDDDEEEDSSDDS